MTYAEMLKDPRWQRKRLEILNRDKWRCLECDSADMQLHVHHGYYEWGRDLWDYPENTLFTLCEQCHSQASEDMKYLKRLIGKCGSFLVPEIIGFVEGLLHRYLKHNPKTYATPLTHARLSGFAAGLNVPTQEELEEINELFEKEGMEAHGVD